MGCPLVEMFFKENKDSDYPDHEELNNWAADKIKELESIIETTIRALVVANESGLLKDTIWTDNPCPETLFDFLEISIDDF